MSFHRVSILAVAFVALSLPRSASAQNAYSDSFEGAAINPFWSVEPPQLGTVALTTDFAHTGQQAVKFTYFAGGPVNVHLNHTFSPPTKGTFSVYFYDTGSPGIYHKIYLYNSSQPNFFAVIGTQDFDSVCYSAYLQNQGLTQYGEHANCGYTQNWETTSVLRSVAWHHFEITVGAASTSFSIDGTAVFTAPGDYSIDSVFIGGKGTYAGTPGYFDDFSFVPPDTAPPLVTNLQVAPDPIAINNGATLTARIDDTTTGNSNIASAAYNIDGGSFSPMSATDGLFDEPTEDVTTPIPAFSSTGVYALCVTGTDAANQTSAPSCVLLPVYDPSAGFVTGGGGIDSPAGKDLVNTSAAGPAAFGFVSKYQKGADTPSGNLEFQFKAGNLNFHSTSMDWLVVTGQPRAMFQGTGTINGTGECKYQVDAWDNSFPSANGSVDAFGIKIYACKSGGDANGNRYSIDATPLSKGSIIIHK